MTSKAKGSIVMLNIYTILLICLFLKFNSGEKVYFFSSILILINTLVYGVITYASRHEIRVHRIVGKSKNQEKKSQFCLNAASQMITLLVFESLLLIGGSRVDLSRMSIFIILTLFLLGFKTLLFTILLRVILWEE